MEYIIERMFCSKSLLVDEGDYSGLRGEQHLTVCVCVCGIEEGDTHKYREETYLEVIKNFTSCHRKRLVQSCY